jgi:1-aminocyclopropane-1-carboxylate deaminase/D-cysteine desulfhydrase-like pyridoxal-dependent ACC family enzyme
MIWPNKKSQVQKLEDPLFLSKKVEIYILRDDLLHPGISGNKWRKLKYNLLDLDQQNIRTVVTVGGPYSNHIAAVAEAGHLFGFRTIGLIRGYESYRENVTLKRAAHLGMDIRFFDKSTYEKIQVEYLDQLEEEIGLFGFLPLGGGNAFGMQGCKEINFEIPERTTDILVPCGTGSTMAGIISGTKAKQRVIGFPAMKNGAFMKDEVTDYLEKAGSKNTNFAINTDYHFGGFAKMKVDLALFLKEFNKNQGFSLDGVYNGKMMFGLYEMLRQDYFPVGSVITAVHTGGVQGNLGLNERYGFNLPL